MAICSAEQSLGSPFKFSGWIHVDLSWHIVFTSFFPSPVPSPQQGEGCSDRKMSEGHLRFPDLPNLTHQIGARFQGRFARLPSGRHDLTRCTHMLKGLDLADQFGNVPADRWSDSLHCLNDPIRIDQKPTPNVYSCFFIVDTVSTPDAASCIRQHRKGNPTFHHLREFFFLPDFVGEAAICTA